jgi:hypothetical protein
MEKRNQILSAYEESPYISLLWWCTFRLNLLSSTLLVIIICFIYRIIAVNYEARNFGVTRGMRGAEARRVCPNVALVHVPEVRGKADLSK